MIRTLEPEALDELDADDPAAQHSRRDLVRLHHMMGTVSILHAGLHEWGIGAGTPTPLKILEIGAGDGSLMLRAARLLSRRWPPVELTLLDRQALVAPETVAAYAALGWTVHTLTTDIEDWARQSVEQSSADQRGSRAQWDIILANLFLHHFADEALGRILQGVAAASDRFLACEPRRSRIALGASHLVGAIGANAVTRNDAVLSVRAGFRGQELSDAWHAHASRAAAAVSGAPSQTLATTANPAAWQMEEHAAGLFSHCFRAQRRLTA